MSGQPERRLISDSERFGILIILDIGMESMSTSSLFNRLYMNRFSCFIEIVALLI
jgi:hypothetical protein